MNYYITVLNKCACYVAIWHDVNKNSMKNEDYHQRPESYIYIGHLAVQSLTGCLPMDEEFEEEQGWPIIS